MPWTDDTIETLKTLWADGLSASQIAKHIGGLTRNAVIGKIHRLGLGGRRKGPKVPHRKRRATQVPRAPKKPRSANGRRSRIAGFLEPMAAGLARPITDLPPLSTAPATQVTILTLRHGLCHWPEGDPKNAAFHFCGRAADGIYCEHHTFRAYLRHGAED